MRIDLRRGSDRFVTESGWATTRHSFSFGRHYDPANVGHGVLVAVNDELVQPHSGYDAHPHQDTEIVTWVLSGSLAHEDSRGHVGVTSAGEIQVLGSGSGVVHGERNDGDEPVRFIQMWLTPTESHLPPSYQRGAPDLTGGGLTRIASGRQPAAVAVRADATLHVGRLEAGDTVELPEAPLRYALVTRGSVTFTDVGPLAEGDEVRLTGGGVQTMTANKPAEVLVWEMY